ncbi:hypothetical protein [Pseudomonas savastanoi]|uniref:hypothetical protein n=1 Tax=Pseudomonas savastanoi TaxID=29438 RepID=UPI000E326C84|nr:hypothetical protein [Pseudomonas savastanoi]
MVKRFTLAAICAASIPHAIANVQLAEVSTQPPLISLHAYVGIGTTSVCGLREAPHLIEHLILSDTEYGENPVDAILALRASGIKLSARTHSDFTEFSLEGPSGSAIEMQRALVTFLGRRSLPTLGFEREKLTITREMGADENYISSPTFYERFISVHAGAVAPCAADSKPFMAYTLDEMNSVFKRMYVADNIRIVAVDHQENFDLDAIASALRLPDTAPPPSHQTGQREDARVLKIEGRRGLVEVIFPIAGRANLPADAAQEMADQARLRVQSHIRRKYQLYAAHTFIDQSLNGGWIRLEVPDLPEGDAAEVVSIAQAAMSNVGRNGRWADPVWASLGSHLAGLPIGDPVIAERKIFSVGVLEQLRRMIAELLALF